jgi:hypothetical protein
VRDQRSTGSEPSTTSLLEPGDDWGRSLTPRQQEAQTLVSILDDFIAGKPMSEPKWRRAFYAASAVFNQNGTRDDW